MQKGWRQTWKNLLFQHFEISDTDKTFEKETFVAWATERHFFAAV